MKRMTYGKVILVVFCILVFPVEDAEAGVDEWTSNGPSGGSVFIFAVDPETPSTIYAAGRGGVLKSTNSGVTWSTASAGLATSYATHVLALAIDPVVPSTLYAGTRDGKIWLSARADDLVKCQGRRF